MQWRDSLGCIVMQKGKVMPEALVIRQDIPPAELRRRARREANGRVASRLLALAHALEGMDRGQAAHLAGMDRQARVCGRW